MLSKARRSITTPNPIVILSRAKDPSTANNLLCAKRILIRAAIFLTLLTTSAPAQNSSYEPDPNWHAPSKPAMRRNPLTASPEITGGGKKLFEVHCAECHQASGSGMADKHSADLRQPIVQSQSDGALFWKITNGNPGRGMPSFSRLPEKQRWQLVLFLRTLRAQARQSATK
jgi:mono/diheme cytochrome c family protein